MSLNLEPKYFVYSMKIFTKVPSSCLVDFCTLIPTIDSHRTEKQLCDIGLTTRPWVAPKGKSTWRESG